MFGFLKNLFGVPQPTGPPCQIATIDSATSLISEHASWDQNVLVVDCPGKDTVRLLEHPLSGIDQCLLGLRFQMSSQDADAGVYPEMWVAVEGIGEAFSKGLNFKLKGTNQWSSCELPFFLRANQKATRLKFNLVFDGPGKVSIQEIELYSTPMNK